MLNQRRFILQILLLQACQGLTTSTHTYQRAPEADETDPAVPYLPNVPHNNKHIVLQQPHTVLLSATVTGGTAFRGVYTGAIAQELRKADGRTDIHPMHISSVAELPAADRAEQTPEYRSTMQKVLILPPAATCD